LILAGRKKPLRLPFDSIMLHLLQAMRDEAHRFAVTGHRRRRKKKQGRSVLEEIPGIGKKRRQQLIQYFGGIQGVERAGPDELSDVPGISRNLAQKIYNNLHT